MHLKCRWCEYTCPEWYRLKNGRTRNGYALLRSHVAEAHHRELAELALAAGDTDTEAWVIERW